MLKKKKKKKTWQKDLERALVSEDRDIASLSLGSLGVSGPPSHSLALQVPSSLETRPLSFIHMYDQDAGTLPQPAVLCVALPGGSPKAEESSKRPDVCRILRVSKGHLGLQWPLPTRKNLFGFHSVGLKTDSLTTIVKCYQ